MTDSRVFENARIPWKTPPASGNEYNFLVDIKLGGILAWHRLLCSSSPGGAYDYGTCFSYPADVPPGTGNRNAVQPAPAGPAQDAD